MARINRRATDDDRAIKGGLIEKDRVQVSIGRRQKGNDPSVRVVIVSAEENANMGEIGIGKIDIIGRRLRSRCHRLRLGFCRALLH
jgi:hypothetical protein